MTTGAGHDLELLSSRVHADKLKSCSAFMPALLLFLFFRWTPMLLNYLIVIDGLPPSERLFAAT